MDDNIKRHVSRRNVLRTGAASALVAGALATAGAGTAAADEGHGGKPGRGPPACPPGHDEDPKGIAADYVAAYNDRDMDTIEDLWADYLIFNGTEIPFAFLEGGIQAYWASFDPLNLEVTRAMAINCEHVVERLEFSGTGTDTEYQGYDVEGESFEVTETTILRAEDGVLTEYWVNWDELGFWSDLGVLEEP